MREKQVFIFLALVYTGLTFAAVGDEVRSAVSSLCSGIQGMLPVAAMLMIVLGAVIYAAGQIMGAETRARANVWATASLTGALFGILIVAVSQPVLNMLYPNISCVGEVRLPACNEMEENNVACVCAGGETCSGNLNFCCTLDDPAMCYNNLHSCENA